MAVKTYRFSMFTLILRRLSISSKSVVMLTTQPLPMMHFACGWTTPMGTKWKATALLS